MEELAAKRVSLAIAFERALDIVGEPSKRALLHYLKDSDISLDNDRADLEHIESTLRTFVGFGAELIMARVRQELAKGV